MLFSRGVRLAPCLTAALLLSAATPAQTGRRAQPVQTGATSAWQADTPASAARREWDAHRDWVHFTTRILGDTAITDSLKALLSSGLSPQTQDRYGRTALHAAILLGQGELARFLLSKGADINARDREGRTPLMVSASAGGIDPFRGFATVSPWGLLWIKPVCDLKEPAEASPALEGFVSWHGHVVGQRPVLRLLLEAGADVSLKDPECRSVLDHAARGGPSGLDRLLPAKAYEGEQGRCDLGLSRSPDVRGLRLGMTLGEVVARLRPSSLAEPEWCGRQALEFDWADDLLGQRAPLPNELSGVRRIRLGFLDGRLAYFRVTYDARDAPHTREQFRSALSDSLGLAGVWRKVDGASAWEQPYSIGCDGFVVMAGYEVGPYVELHDTGAIDLLLRRREEGVLRRLREEKEERERKRRVFKP
jgi:hypothetical protein